MKKERVNQLIRWIKSDKIKYNYAWFHELVRLVESEAKAVQMIENYKSI